MSTNVYLLNGLPKALCHYMYEIRFGKIMNVEGAKGKLCSRFCQD